MATVLNEGSRPERRYHERRKGWVSPFGRTEGMRVSWGGIWGGVLVALGLLMLLTALGLAVGVSTVEPGQTQASSLGTGAGIWASIALLISLFVGGMAATRIGAITDRTTGFFEGALVWVVSVLLIAYAASAGISTLASGAFRLVGGATQALGAVAQSQGGLDLDVSGSVDQIASRLRDPQTAQRIASVTGLPVAEVRSTLDQTAQRVEQAQSGVSAAAWITFGALVLSLIAAALGAMYGRRKAVAVTAKGPAADAVR
jgi:X-X-X-Leu-X-X-Gly heptad repeat protein